MTPSSYVKLFVAGLAVAGAGWVGVTLWRGSAAIERAESANTAVVQHQAAAASTKQMQGSVDAANQRLRAADAARSAARDRLAAAEQRVQSDTPDAIAYSGATLEALREYAASLDRDFERCREAYIRVVGESAEASDAAHALSSAWPSVDAWNAAANAFALKGITK